MPKFLASRWLQRFFLGCGCLLLLLIAHSASIAQTQRVLTVGTEPAFPPFEFQAAGGGLQGFDIDLMQAIAQAEGFRVEFQSLPFDGLIPGLQARTVDAAISSMTITAERQKTVDFSPPYFKAGLAIAVRTNNTSTTDLASLQNQTIGVQIGTTGAETARKISGATIRTFDSAPLALQALLNGNVSAVINDAPVTLYAIKANSLNGIKVTSQLLTEEFYGIALPQNSPNLAQINAGLTRILSNGTYDQIYRKWFNAQAPSLTTATVPGSTSQAETATPATSGTVITRALPILLQGALITLELTALSVCLGLIGGTLMGLARLSASRPLRWFARAYIDFFRGTPLLVQILMIYFGIPALAQGLGFTFTFDRLAAAVLALSLNSTAYLAEIVRAGIQSIEVGQVEAAQSLGLGPGQALRYVVFPQAFRRMLPPLGNEFITLLKDTSLVSVIGFEELLRRGQLIVADNYRAFEIYAAVALVYLALNLLSSQAFNFLEARMDPTQRSRQPNSH